MLGSHISLPRTDTTYRSSAPTVGLFIIGIALPLIALASIVSYPLIESLSITANLELHALVPIVNVLVWVGVRCRHKALFKTLALANGFAISVAAFYVTLLLFATPVNKFALDVILMPLITALSLGAAVRLRMYLSALVRLMQLQTHTPVNPMRLWPGLLLGVVVSVVVFTATLSEAV